MASGARGRKRGLLPLPGTRICASGNRRSSLFRSLTSCDRSPCNSIKPTMAKSREVRKLDQNRHLVYGQWHDGPLGLPHSQATHRGKRSAEAHGRAPPVAYLKPWSNLPGSAREGAAQGAIRDGDALIDGGAGELGLLAGLESHVVQQGGLGERIFRNRIGVMNTFPPTDKVQQVLRITSEREVRYAAEAFEIQIAIDPIDLAARGLLDDAERAACVIGGRLVNDTEFHGRAASSRDWNCRASPPCMKKLLGSWPSGRETRRVSIPRSRRLRERHRAACWPLPLGSASKVR